MSDTPTALTATVGQLIGFYTHIRDASAYREAFVAAAEATSKEDSSFNQALKYVRQAALYSCAVDVLDHATPGDFAECGCFRGQSAHVLASLLEARGARPFHIFDSFEGLSEIGAKDIEGRASFNRTDDEIRRHFAFPEDVFRQRMAKFERVDIHRGWIPDRFADVADRAFALVHIDVDLHQPTRDSLIFFYPRMSPGGWIVVDDYNAAAFPGATAAVDDFVAATRPAAAVPGQVGGFLIRK